MLTTIPGSRCSSLSPRVEDVSRRKAATEHHSCKAIWSPLRGEYQNAIRWRPSQVGWRPSQQEATGSFKGILQLLGARTLLGAPGLITMNKDATRNRVARNRGAAALPESSWPFTAEAFHRLRLGQKLRRVRATVGMGTDSVDHMPLKETNQPGF